MDITGPNEHGILKEGVVKGLFNFMARPMIIGTGVDGYKQHWMHAGHMNEDNTNEHRSYKQLQQLGKMRMATSKNQTRASLGPLVGKKAFTSCLVATW